MLSAVDEEHGSRPGDYSTTFARRVALDDRRRCQSRRQFKTVPPEYWPQKCWKIAKKNSRYCAQCAKSSGEVRVHYLPRFYKTHLSQTLSAALDRVAENEQDALQLREELRLIRVTADDAVVLYGQALDVREQAPDDASRKAAQAIVDRAGEAMRAALREVSEQVLSAAKVESLSKDVFSPQAVRLLVDQLVRLAYAACGEEHQEIAERWEQMIRDDLRLLSDSPRGTKITPDADVLEMDRTVPTGV